MSTKKKFPRNAVSFNQFRRLQLAAFQGLRSSFVSEDCSAPVDAKIISFACERALIEGRYGDAVVLARSLSSQQYGDPRSFRLGAQLTALVKKVPFRDSSLDPEGSALGKFLQAEADCRSANEVLRDLGCWANGTLTTRGVIDDDAQRIVSLLIRARKHVFRVMGNKPPVQRILDLSRFGSGSNRGVHGNSTHLLRKLSAERWSVSHVAEPFARAAAKRIPAFWRALGLKPEGVPELWDDPMSAFKCVSAFQVRSTQSNSEDFDRRWRQRIVLEDSDLITYVPKDSDCHRTVGTQPLLNVFVQLGAGDYMRDHILRDRCHIDIRTAQVKVNGPLALLGSACEGMPFATIDLASASDCMSIELIKFLCPPEWFAFLNSIRTPSYVLPDDDKVRRYEKFCAMGNGFCFPLETIVFWSLCQAVYDLNVVPDRTCAVYGDDIIVYQSTALELIELLNAVGFQTNTSKTFVFGPFRESCGQDYFNGVNVRPVILDEILENASQVYHLINSLQRKGFTTLAEQMRLLLPKGMDLYRPCSGETTTALEVPYDVFMASRHARWVPSLQCWSWNELLTRPIEDEDEYDPQNHLSAALCGASPNEDGTPTFAYRRKTKVHMRRVAHA